MFISKHKSQHTNTHYKQRNEEIIPIPSTPHLYIAASTRLQRPDSEPHAPLPRAGPTPQRAGGGKGKDCTPDGGRHSKDQRLRCHLSILGGNEEAGHDLPDLWAVDKLGGESGF
eukprot:scaffold30583_cov132-Isochrysis_galbana.AAC.1